MCNEEGHLREQVVGYIRFKSIQREKGTIDAIVLKTERDINKKLLTMRKKDEISENLYTRMRSTGRQPARLYGLAMVHEENTPLRPVLSLPGSS